VQELVDKPPALFVVRPGLLDALTIMVCPGVVDQLIRLATNTPVRKSIRLVASCPPTSFEAPTCALGFDSLNRKPLSDRFLRAAALLIFVLHAVLDSSVTAYRMFDARNM